MCENAAQTPESLADVESGILRDVMADGLRKFEESLQAMADAEPAVGSDGRRLRRQAHRHGDRHDLRQGAHQRRVRAVQVHARVGDAVPRQAVQGRARRGVARA